MEFKFIYLDKLHSVKLIKKEDSYKITINNNTQYEITDFLPRQNLITFVLNGKFINVYFAYDKDRNYLAFDSNYFIFETKRKKTISTKGTVSQKGNTVASPMPGLLVKLPVAIGDKVTTGTTLAIVEAMKMQNELYAPCDGIVKKINFKEGEQVDALQVIVELEAS